MGIDLVTSGTVLRTRRGGGKRQVDQLTASKPLSQGSCRGHSCIGGVPSGGQAAPRCLSAGAFQPLFLSSCGSLLCRCFPCFPLRQFWWLPVTPSVCLSALEDALSCAGSVHLWQFLVVPGCSSCMSRKACDRRRLPRSWHMPTRPTSAMPWHACAGIVAALTSVLQLPAPEAHLPQKVAATRTVLSMRMQLQVTVRGH